MRWGGKNDAPLQDVLLLEQSNPFQCGLDSPKNGIYHTANYQNLLVPSMGSAENCLLEGTFISSIGQDWLECYAVEQLYSITGPDTSREGYQQNQERN